MGVKSISMLVTQNEWHDWDMIAMMKTVLHVYVYESWVRDPTTPSPLAKWCFIMEVLEIYVEWVSRWETKEFNDGMVISMIRDWEWVDKYKHELERYRIDWKIV